jgi:G patch domain/KOW motif-containing protein
MEKSNFSFGLSMGNSQLSQRNSVQRTLTPQNVMQDRNRDDDDDDMDTEPSQSFTHSITSFDGTFKKPEEVKKFIVIPAAASSIDESKPMLLRNRPEGITEITDEKEKYLHDVASRANDNTIANYNKVDVFKFGEGLLRGLGWTPGGPVGKSNKGVTEVVALISRPERLGLGAKPKPPPMGDAKLTGKHIRPGEPKQYMEAPRDKDGKVRHYRTLDEDLKVAKKPFYDGCPVYVLRGVHKGMKGKVLNSEDGVAKVVLPNEEIVKIDFHEMEQADDPDVIRRRAYEAKEEKERAKEEKERAKNEKESKKDDRYQREKEKERKRERDGDRDMNVENEHSSKKYKSNEYSLSSNKTDYRQSSSSRDSSQKSSRDNNEVMTILSDDEDDVVPSQTWLTTKIRVKIVSKEFQGGKYYCKAGWIVDLLGNGKCSIMIDDSNRLVEGFKESDLETCVPSAGGQVVVLRGEYKGERGKIIEKDSKRDRVQVQLEDSFDIVALKLDDVAQRK